MGREAASAIARWFVLNDFPAKLELTAVCDLNESLLKWYEQIPTCQLRTTDYKKLLADKNIDVVYVAVPHNLHEQIYLDVLRAGKDLLAEKPFGIDLKAAKTIRDEAKKLNRFVRCSSEFPFLPGVQRVISEVKKNAFGKILEIRAGFLHSSDLDPAKTINWKRQVKTCGEIGVMGDLGMHVVHVPFRLGWKPVNIYAQLQKIYNERPDGRGRMAVCDTFDNAKLNTDVIMDGRAVPMLLEMKRMSPGDTNTWYIEVLGTDGGVKFSTKEPKTLWIFSRGKEQFWNKTDLGFNGQFPAITGGIFEPGFPDCFQQMLAAFVAEREGFLGDKFGCVTPDEAVLSHEVFEAALNSNRNKSVVNL